LGPTRDPGHLGYLDALRGYAIFGVMVLHTLQRSPGLPRVVNRLFWSGQHGVQLFFVVSAVTLLRSWTARHDGAGAFYLRRFFRIAPMWFLFILGWTVLRGLGPNEWAPSGLAVTDVLSAVVFLHVWLPNAIDSVVPGGWSIGVEAMFYLIFPLLAAWLTTRSRAAVFVGFTIAVAYAANALVAPHLGSVSPYVRTGFLYFWFPNQLPAFAFGILAFQFIHSTQPPRWLAELAVGVGLAAILLVPTLTPWSGPIAYGPIFAILIFGMAQGGGRYLVNRLVRWCGQRSYSAYFWHLALIGLAGFLPAPDPYTGYALKLGTLLIATFALSHLTFTFIERPGIDLGRRLLAKGQHPTTAETMPAATSGV
jgi:peptidoglycan/LPS O-acetylase OafA/YrhL